MPAMCLHIEIFFLMATGMRHALVEPVAEAPSGAMARTHKPDEAVDV